MIKDEAHWFEFELKPNNENLINDSDESANEVTNPLIDLFYQFIVCLTNKLTKSKEQDDLEKNLNSS